MSPMRSRLVRASPCRSASGELSEPGHDDLHDDVVGRRMVGGERIVPVASALLGLGNGARDHRADAFEGRPLFGGQALQVVVHG